MHGWRFRRGTKGGAPDDSGKGKGAGGLIGGLFRTLKSGERGYLSIGYWKGKRTEYVKSREKEKNDLNVYQSLRESASPALEYYVLIVLSCIIATTGLIQGSVAVIIGAMIIAPLMAPILAFSLAVIWGDVSLLKTAVLTLLKGIVLAVAISTLITLIIPFSNLSTEIVSRTNPSILDIIVALAAGALAAYGFANKKVSNALTGIAIAVALMPPLCTLGIGIGKLNVNVALGAGLLFCINLVSISLSGGVVFWLMKIHPLAEDSGMVKRRALWQIVLSILLLVAIAVPVAAYMKTGYELDRAQEDVKRVVSEMVPDGSLLSMRVSREKGGYSIALTITTGIEPGIADVSRLKSEISRDNPIFIDEQVTFVKAFSVPMQ